MKLILKNVSKIKKKLTEVFYTISPKNGQILMFHRIVEDENHLFLKDIEATCNDLEKTIKYYLNNGYKVISLNDLVDYYKGDINLPKKHVIFTFDDGYKDNFTLAYPLFKKYNIPFTIYVTSGFPDQTIEMWWYALKDLINAKKNISFMYKDNSYSFNCNTDQEKSNTWNALHSMIMSHGADRKELFFKLFEKNNINVKNYSKTMALTWEEIKRMANDPIVTIGSHTMNHYNSCNLTLDELYDEIKVSTKKIESMISKKIEHFAFPYGGRKHAYVREYDIAKKFNFKTIMTTRYGHVSKKNNKNNSIMPRVEINHDIIKKIKC